MEKLRREQSDQIIHIRMSIDDLLKNMYHAEEILKDHKAGNAMSHALAKVVDARQKLSGIKTT